MQDARMDMDVFLPIIEAIARRVKRRAPGVIELADLLQEGFLGLADAAKKYDRSHGASFRTYARNRIRWAMLDWVKRELLRGDHESLDAPINGDETWTLHDLLPGSDGREVIGNISVDQALSRLPARSAGVIRAYCIEGRELKSLAPGLGVSQSMVTLIKAKAIKNLRKGWCAHV